MRRFLFAILLLPGCGPDGTTPSIASGGSESHSSGGSGASGGSPSGSSGGAAPGGGAPARVGGSENSGGKVGDAAGGAWSGGGAGESPGGAGPGGGATGDDTIGVFVAQGHAGRTVVSCDFGKTWALERYAAAEYRNVPASDLYCWSGAVNYDPVAEEYFDLDCDHHAFAGRGIAYGAGAFLATFGWGDPGAVRHTKNGVDWATPIDGTTFGGVGYVQGAWIAAGGDSRISTDNGETFAVGPNTGMQGNVRRVGTTSGHGERMILVGDNAEARVTSDGGKTWWTPSEFPAECGVNIQTEGGIASNGNAWLVVGGDGIACRSTDGGETWSSTSVGASSLSSQLVWDGDLFMVWSRGKRYASPDGASWTTAAITPDNIEPGPAAASPDGSIVAIRGGWDVWYEDQRFYRSDDGLVWTEAESYLGSHPIRAVAFGEVNRPSECQK